MTNGIVIKGISYKAVNVNTAGVAPFDNCSKCDLRRICDKTGVEYACRLFQRKDHLVYFKKLG